MSCVRSGWLPARCWWALLLAALFGGAPAAAVVDGQPAPYDDRRLDAVGLVLTVQPWAPCGGWISGSGTLIAPNVVLLAKHSVQRSDYTLPADGARSHRIRFRRAPDGAAENHFSGNISDCATPSQEIYISRFVGCPFVGVDIVLGILESEPVGITPIGVNLDFAFPAGHAVRLAGWGYSGRCIQTGEAWTLRTDTGVLPTQRFTSPYYIEYNQVTFSGSCMNLPAAPAAQPDWIIGNMHDSGAPILIEVQDPRNPDRRDLRVVAIVTSYTGAQPVRSWNSAGGEPPLENPITGHDCAEFDGLPGVTTNDMFAYVNSWITHDPAAETDGQPDITLSDLLTFVGWFLGGC